jgi:hypothetical protein
MAQKTEKRLFEIGVKFTCNNHIFIVLLHFLKKIQNHCTLIYIYLFDPHMSKATRLTSVLLITIPGFSRITTRGFLARIWGIFCTATSHQRQFSSLLRILSGCDRLEDDPRLHYSQFFGGRKDGSKNTSLSVRTAHTVLEMFLCGPPAKI